MLLKRQLLPVLGLSALLASSSFGQWITQTLSLRPGWNAVYLTVRPEPSSCEDAFNGYPVESVWMWNKRFTPTEFVQSPDELLPQNPHWLVWLPSANSESFLSTVFQLEAGSAYLVKVFTNASPFTISLKGRPELPSIDWYPHALNLVGFPLNPTSPPTFGSFFSHIDGVDTSLGQDNQLFELDALGRGKVIARPERTNMQPGVAYWIKCKGDMDYAGPIQVEPASGGGMDFGDVSKEQDITIQNVSTTAAYTVVVSQESSEPPPAGEPELAGPVPLSYLVKDATNGVLSWVQLTGAGLSRALGPGESWTLRFGVRRNDVGAFTPTGTNGACYQSILRISDSGRSVLLRLPVIAETDTVRIRPPGPEDELDDHHPNEGLWVGRAILNEVNCPAYTTNELLPTVSTLPMRLILHVDGQGQVRLLQHVTFAWSGSDTNGEFELYASDANVPTNSPEVNRLTAVAFPIMSPVLVTNVLTNAASTGLTNLLGCVVTTAFDDPTNPFLHKYHPGHDNKDWNFQPYSNAVETVTIERDIVLDLTGSAFTNGVADPYWGIDEIGGVYNETLLGVRQQPIYIRGVFYLERVCRLGTLN